MPFLIKRPLSISEGHYSLAMAAMNELKKQYGCTDINSLSGCE